MSSSQHRLRLDIFQTLWARGVAGGIKQVLADAEEVEKWVTRPSTEDLLGTMDAPPPEVPETAPSSSRGPGRPRRMDKERPATS